MLQLTLPCLATLGTIWAIIFKHSTKRGVQQPCEILLHANPLYHRSTWPTANPRSWEEGNGAKAKERWRNEIRQTMKQRHGCQIPIWYGANTVMHLRDYDSSTAIHTCVWCILVFYVCTHVHKLLYINFLGSIIHSQVTSHNHRLQWFFSYQIIML